MDNELPAFAVRFSVQASQDVTNETYRLLEITEDISSATAWGDSLYEETGTLATMPTRFAVQERESRLFRQQIRIFLFRRYPNAPAYHVLYSVSEEGADGPVVWVVHVRHASRKPLTRREAQEILANQ